MKYIDNAGFRKTVSGLRVALFMGMLVVSLAVLGCIRGNPTEKPPIHVNPDMDDQPRYDAQEASPFFADGSAMRMPVPGTVARGDLKLDRVYYEGKNSNGEPVKESPVLFSKKVLERGRERYDIYCAACHSRVGDGQGTVVQRGYIPAPSFHQDYVREYADGHIYDVINNGIRNMPAYGHQIPVDDRWAIVGYMRALQKSQNASKDDVPEEILKDLK
jgi:cytochrome c5